MLKYDGQGRNRTADASLFRAALYRLSYLAISGGLHTCIFGGTSEDFVRTERFDYNNPAEFTQTELPS
jgi:hypothetical protein